MSSKITLFVDIHVISSNVILNRVIVNCHIKSRHSKLCHFKSRRLSSFEIVSLNAVSHEHTVIDPCVIITVIARFITCSPSLHPHINITIQKPQTKFIWGFCRAKA